MNIKQVELLKKLYPHRVYGPRVNHDAVCALHFEYAKANRSASIEKYKRQVKYNKKKIKTLNERKERTGMTADIAEELHDCKQFILNAQSGLRYWEGTY